MQRSLFLACLLFCANLFAQQYPFVYYTPKDGLANSRVRSIKQDSRGRMYFITFGGLSIYDGARFTNYNKENGLAHDLVNDITEAGPDSILVATNTTQLNTLVRGKTGVYKTADGFYPLINRFLKSSDGRLYTAADDGLFVLENRRFRKLPFADKNGTEVGKTLDRILEWKDFFLILPWGDVGYGLALYNRKEQRLVATFTKSSVFAVAADRQGLLWISTGNGISFLDTAALLQGGLKLLPLPVKYAAGKTSLPANIFCDAENNTWFYAGNSVQKLEPHFQRQAFSLGQGLKTGTVTDLFRDREGTVWMATNGNGVIKLNSTRVQLLNAFSNSESMGLMAMQQQGDTVWLFNQPNNTVYRLYHDVFTPYSLGRTRMAAGNLLLQGQRLYLGDGKKWVSIKNKTSLAAYRSPEISWQTGGDSSTFGTAIQTKDGAVVQEVYKGNKGYFLAVFKNGRCLMEHPVSYATDQLCLDAEGRLWLATRTNNLMVFTLHPEEPQRYLQLQREYTKELPPQLHPRSMAVDGDGNVWMGTRYNGLYRLAFKNDSLVSIQQFTTKNGLTDNFIYHLHCDRNNTVWIGTQTGLDKIYRKGNRYIIGNISKTHNFFQSVLQIVSTTNGTVYALTNEGHLLKVETSGEALSSSPPSLLLTSLRVNNQEWRSNDKSFTSHQNSLSFQVAAPSFIDEKSIRYNYKLQSSGNAVWTEPSNNAVFNAGNLSPGNYTLQAQAQFPEELYPPQALQYSFTILPPWWQTWWFRAGIGLLLITALILAIRFYYRRKLQKQKAVLEKQQAIEKERTRIATDMHDDLGATLSRIKFLSEGIAFKKAQGQTFDEDVVRIKTYSHQMIDRMGEIVWALNEKNDSLADLLAYTRAYAVEYLSENGIGCTVAAPADVPPLFVSGEFRRNVFLSVKEILHNAVKHAGASEVAISFSLNKTLNIRISDNGKGFISTEMQRYGNGLYNLKKRAGDIGGNLDITSGNGTTVAFTVPLPDSPSTAV